MKYFFSASMVATTVRKAGYYPTSRVAAFLAKRFAFLFEVEKNDTAVSAIAGMLKGDTSGWDWCLKHLSTTEYQALYEFGEWWSCELSVSLAEAPVQHGAEAETGEVSICLNDRSFILVNLNRGRMLTILSRTC